MAAHTQVLNLPPKASEIEIFAQVQIELINRYAIDPRLASEMAWDLVEVITAIDGDLDIFQKYFLQ